MEDAGVHSMSNLGDCLDCAFVKVKKAAKSLRELKKLRFQWSKHKVPTVVDRLHERERQYGLMVKPVPTYSVEKGTRILVDALQPFKRSKPSAGSQQVPSRKSPKGKKLPSRSK